jgi:fibronectin type 3 domain-containing protein
MNKMIYFKIVIIFFLSALLTTCSLEGDIEALRRKLEENPSSSVAPPRPANAPMVIAESEQLTVSWQAVERATAYEIWAGTANNSNTATKYVGDVLGLSAIITGLTNGTTYYVWIKAKNDVNTSGFSPVASGTPSIPVTAPQAPSTPTVSIGDEQITVIWAAVEGATTYEIWLAMVNNSAIAAKHGEDVSGTSVTLTGLANGTTYYVWVKAKNSVGTSEFSPAASGIPSIPITVPQAPSTPTISIGNGQITVTWTAVQGAEKYEVYIDTMQNPPASPEKTVLSTTTVLTDLTNRTVYYVWVKAVNEHGSSDFSPRARGIPWPANTVPAVPGRPFIIPGINQLTVTWEENGGASSYEVYINKTTTTPSTPAVTSDKTSAVINNLENGVIYYIWVRAVNSAGKSAYSPVEAGTPHIPTVAPAAPDRPVLTVSSRELTVSWQAVELTESYEVWFGTSDNSTQAQKFGGDITGGITETIITGLTNEQTYYVWIKAKNIVGTSDFSPVANAKPSAFVVLPEKPTTPTVTLGNRELFVNWQSVEGTLFYEVWTGATNNSTNATKYGADISGTATVLTGLSNGIAYYIWIKAKNNIGISEFSPVASGTPSAFATTPPTPSSAPTISAGSGQLTLSWQAAEGANDYEIWTGTTINPTTATKHGGDVSSTSATITGLTNGTTYYIWIKAKNSIGTSGFSPVASGVPNLTPGLYRNNARIGNQNLSAALSYISANAVTGDNFYIVLGANESISPATLGYSGKTIGITLMGYGGERTITLASNGRMFTINAGITLTLDENITLMGMSTNNNSLVVVNNGSAVIMNDGAKVSGNNPSGIYVSGGTVTMNGGVISGNAEDSGIVVNTGIFTMNGGAINGNTGNGNGGGGGGVIVFDTFIMNGGTISGNTTKNNGGGICVYSPGVFTMNGGIISGNAAGSGGGGIFVLGATATVVMNNGTISGNTASSGGGISNSGGTFTMHGGIISGNTANTYGGGVSSSGTFKKLPSGGGQNSGTIYGNEETGVDANGVPLKNTVNSAGHAVYSSSNRSRNTTAGQTDQIDTTTGRGLSTNGNPPYGN